MMRFFRLALPCLMAGFLASGAAGQEIRLQPSVSIGQEQMMMLQAAQLVLQGKLAEAESLYSQVIGLKPDYLQAYIQRAIVRREQDNRAGMEADAVALLDITQRMLRQRPQEANLYYSRGMAYRLLRDYPKAKADIVQALKLRPDSAGWKQDLQAIALEEKMM